MPLTGHDVVVLGVGNSLWGDDGFGVCALDMFARSYEVPENVTLLDGGTRGLYLTPWIQGARRLLMFDAVDLKLEPGTLIELEKDEIPRLGGTKKIDLHQMNLQDMLATADLMGRLPEDMALIGVQPVTLDNFGGGLSDEVRAAIAPALDLAVRRLRQWGVELRPKARTASREKAVWLSREHGRAHDVAAD
ncbi:MAG: HyaD/HybD family hydrogenase maturation endopeptidase [Alphaproteobacteria bacterium]